VETRLLPEQPVAPTATLLLPQRRREEPGAFPVNVCRVIRRGSGGPKSRMAKDSDHLAGSFETTGGMLTGFLAEGDDFDRRSLWRLGSWGVGTVGAVIVAVLANQSSIGWRRERTANVDLARQSQQIQSITREGQNEMRRLASAIDTLNGDRDRLYSRVTVLEQGLDSVTGSIARQNAVTVSSQAASQSSSIGPSSIVPAAPPSTVASTSPPPATSAASAISSSAPASPAKAEPPVAQSAAPAVAPVATAAAAKGPAMPDKPPPVAATSEPGSAPGATSTGKMASNTPATPLMPAKSIMAPPDAAAGKLTAPDTPPDTPAAADAPVVIAAAPSPDDAAPAASTVQRTEFAVDVGTANSVAGLRALWRGLLKSKSNSALAALRPLIAVKEASNGLGMQLRLVAGPLSDAAAAAKICAGMMESKRATCETTVFDGQQLALKDDEPAASVTPTAVRPALHRRTIVKRVMVVESPKPQPATSSSWFSR
jgi:hypothetical protein